MGFFKLSPEKILLQHGIKINNVQREIIESVDKYKVTICNCSRRSGKTMLASACAMAKALEPNASIAITAPLGTMSDILFRNIDKMSHDSLNIKPSKFDNKKKEIQWEWDSIVTCTTLKNMRAILGKANHLCIVEEAALAAYLNDI